jgi:hypothetical protein
VLVVGGMAGGGGGIASIEMFNPLDNSIRQAGSLATPRASHTTTLLPDGRVLIAGGYNGDYLASVEIFDPETGELHSGGTLSEARSGQTATMLSDGRILFAGGVGRGWTFLRTAELYDPATGRSETVGSMSVPRESHTATLLADGRVLIAGGHAGRRENMVVYSSAEIFSPRSRSFEGVGDLATARHKHDAIRLADGRVLVIGGADRTDRIHSSSTEVYNPGTSAFDAGPAMAHRRYKIENTSVLLPNGNVLVTSGATVPELLDFGSMSFREIEGRLPEAYRFAAAAVLRGGDVLISGGYSNGIENTSGVWRYQQPRSR